MQSESMLVKGPVFNLNRAFFLNHPAIAARELENIHHLQAAEMLEQQDHYIAANVFENIAPGTADEIFKCFSMSFANDLLLNMDTSTSLALLSRLSADKREEYFAAMSESTAKEYRSLLAYPEDSIGRIMSSHIIAFNKNTVVNDAIRQLKSLNMDSIQHLFLLNDEMKLEAEVEIQKLALVDGKQQLNSISRPIITYVTATDSKEELLDKLEKFAIDTVPVVDINFKLIGVVRSQGLMEAMREDISSDMQTMVGASKDERALSSTFFAVRKRLPWLQINLLTAFMAAAVVGIFEETIAQFTALAILLPIAAGQSGNAGAQALAVTMRGLTLREISMKHWFKVMMKELRAGFLNGIGIAVTCALGVYLWSRSSGLALVMALAMIISMTIAGVSGALVPIMLKRFGLDPAQSSSIVLTTVTDIAGFMSFLGIATILSGLLVAT
tara:strand:- start:51652 stop:52977 length:1326 start_codon:yes stop_codon:yes gene_type:complete